ncbi:hypothetical protein HBB04_02435 [Pseudomonas coronafaciens]|nr:hypothetical protein HBB04_02435 [Pseudomonas coronafaciens]
MPRLISKPDRIPTHIPIRIQPTLTKRAQTVRAVKPHQHRVISPIPIPQQIMPRHRIASLAIEPQQTGQAAFSRMVTVGTVSNRLSASLVHKLQNRTLLIGRQQRGFDHTLNTPLLGQ